MTVPDTNSPAGHDTAVHAALPHNTAAVIVWRLATGAAADTGPDPDDSPLTARLARHLVAIYTDVHDTVACVGIGADTELRHAAEHTGRRYLPLPDPAAPTTRDELARPANLILLRWPCPTTTLPHHVTSLLRACRDRLARDGSIVVVIDDDSSAQQERVVLPAARAAGLRHLDNIIVADTDADYDSYTYTTAPAAAGTPDAARQPTTTLMILGHLQQAAATAP